MWPSSTSTPGLLEMPDMYVSHLTCVGVHSYSSFEILAHTRARLYYQKAIDQPKKTNSHVTA
jgi:hypothetical protein